MSSSDALKKRRRGWWAIGLGASLVAAGIVAGSSRESAARRAVPIVTSSSPVAAAMTAPPKTADEAPKTPPPRYFPFLPGEDTSGSVSVGDTSNGYLIGSAELTESEAVRILPTQKKRDLRFGTKPIIAMLEAAGRALFSATQTRLWLGNIGRVEGGDISWSVSHNSGRDADIAFCYMNKKGEPKDPPDLIPLNGQGLAKGQDLRLDPKRTWLVIKALIEHPEAEVQYLFIAEGLKTQILMEASGMGHDPALIQRAAAVMIQPHGSAPHNDHLHLRIFCSERDVLGGCVNSGSIHPGTNLHTAARKKFIDTTASLLNADEPDHRRRAIDRLTLLDAREAADKITDMLGERDFPEVRVAAARSLARLGGPKQVPALTDLYAAESSALVRIAVTQSIGDIGGRDAGVFLARAVGRPQRAAHDVVTAMGAALELGGPSFLSVLPQAVDISRKTLLTRWWGDDAPSSEVEADALVAQLVAIEAAAKSERMEPVGRLMRLLEDPRGLVRDRAAHALQMITNLSYHIDWKSENELILAKGRGRWQRAYQRSRGAPRDAWLATGFQAAGFKVKQINQSFAWELVRAVASGSDYVSFNAQRSLMRLTNHRPPSTTWSKGSACMHWLKWVRGRRKSYRLEKPPKKVFRGCASAR